MATRSYSNIIGPLTADEMKELLAALISEMVPEEVMGVLENTLDEDTKAELGEGWMKL